MTANEIFLIVVYLIGSAALCLAGMLGFSLVLHAQKRIRQWLPALFYILLLMAIGSGPILANRNLEFAATEINQVVEGQTSLVMWGHRFFLLGILSICFARFITVLARGRQPMGQGRGLYFAFLGFFGTNIVFSSFMGTVPVFDHKVIYALFLFTAVYLTRQHELEYSIQGAKIGLLVFLLASLAVAAFMPHIAVQPNYLDGWIPFIRFRLWGLGPHANSVGPLALVFILITLHKPFGRNWMQYLSLLTGLTVLVLTQSKTVWFATVLALGIYAWGYGKSNIGKQRPHRKYSFRGYLRKISGPMLLGALGIAVVAALGIYAMNLLKLGTQSSEIASISGRTYIWSAAIKAWQQNVLFGYGLSAWGEKFRAMIDMSFAFNAHNQFLQSLSSAGILGLAGLIVYLIALGRYSLKVNKATKGLALALFSIVFIRCYTETPFSIDNIFVSEFVIHLLLFRVSLAQIKSNKAIVYRRMQEQLRWA